ncbi:MAG: patatin-like phospholipase family protein [Microcoleus sp.]
MFTNNFPKDSYRILSCDGGVIRGILTAALLEELEKQLRAKNPERQLRDYFDIIAGTSTGSLLACGIANGISAKEMKELYRYTGLQIFPPLKDTLSSLIWRLLNEEIDFSEFDTFNLLHRGKEDTKKFMSQPVYDGEGLEEVLKDIFGCQQLGELPKLAIVPSYDVYNHDAVIFKNNAEEFKTMPVWEVCRASCAAPVAFPAHVTQNEEFLKSLKAKAKKAGEEATIKVPDDGIPLIDGGIVANNPVLCAIAECRTQFKTLPSVVASFGSGWTLNRITVREAKGWGGFNWTSLLRNIPLMDVFSDGSSDATDYIAKQLLKGESEYFRFQPLLKENVSAFSADPDNLNLLVEIAERFLETEECKEDMGRLVESLTSSDRSFLGSLVGASA